MSPISQLLGGLAPQDFLVRYWQKRPLLVRNALPGFQFPLDPDELAGLACEAEVESRLVLERGGATPWALEYGPFDEARFAALPESHWTLLVQECNKYVPELAELLACFDFIPNWRIDDIMVSYAPDQGSVGPHLDQYDVFLIQGLGTRRWQISTAPVAADNFIAGLDLRIMREFTSTEEWVLTPGDMLYLPPGIAHYGVALEDCMTLSVGFRAPTHAELITGFLDDAARLDGEQRYGDPNLELQAHPGEIAAKARQRVRDIIRAAVADDEAIDNWLGRFVTEAKSGQVAEAPPTALEPAALRARLQEDGCLLRSEYARFAYMETAHGTTLFVDGNAYRPSAELTPAVQLLCDRRHYDSTELEPYLARQEFLSLLLQLYNSGYVYFPDEQ
jgi:50S ribosomal protein L16 3-hydroxylase